MTQHFKVVIPARHASTRLPGKALLPIAGRAMTLRVVDQARQSLASEVIVATDYRPIENAVAAEGVATAMTSADHPSGSDRVMEVARQRAWPPETVIVNVQGDEPLIPPAVIDQVAELILEDATADVATLCQKIVDPLEFQDPSAVKVVTDASNHALYFSRAPIPHPRDGAFTGAMRHIGLYAYRVRALEQFVVRAPGHLELLEKLEQLRFLENGMRIRIAEAKAPVPGGVDTPEDLARVRAAFGDESGSEGSP